MPRSLMVAVTGVLKLATPAMLPLSGLVQLNPLTGPPVDVQLRLNVGSSVSGVEVNVNGVPAVQSTVTVPAEGSRLLLHTFLAILWNYTHSSHICAYPTDRLLLFLSSVQMSL